MYLYVNVSLFCVYMCIYKYIVFVCECMCLPMCDIWGEHPVAELLLKEKGRIAWTRRNRCTRVLTFYVNVKKV